jgi:hypothetical protein
MKAWYYLPMQKNQWKKINAIFLPGEGSELSLACSF